MVNDIIFWIFNLIDYFFSYFADFLGTYVDMMNNASYYLDEFRTIMSYVFFFIPSFHLGMMLAVVVVFTILRIFMSIANLIWP